VSNVCAYPSREISTRKVKNRAAAREKLYGSNKIAYRKSAPIEALARTQCVHPLLNAVLEQNNASYLVPQPWWPPPPPPWPPAAPRSPAAGGPARDQQHHKHSFMAVQITGPEPQHPVRRRRFRKVRLQCPRALRVAAHAPHRVI
jgi:hypothetical protein